LLSHFLPASVKIYSARIGKWSLNLTLSRV
jgi:hypothetical protein